MGKTGNQPCNTASRRASGAGYQAVVVPAQAVRGAARYSRQAAQGIREFLESRYGFERKERMIVYESLSELH